MKPYFILFVVAVLGASVQGLTHSEFEGDSHVQSRRHLHEHGMSIDPVLRSRDDGGAVLDDIMAVLADTFYAYIQDPQKRSRYQDKPPTLEVTVDRVLKGVENLLSSSRVKKIAKNLAKKAAVVYRAIQDEI